MGKVVGTTEHLEWSARTPCERKGGGEGRGGERGCAQLEGRRRKRTFTGKRKRESGRGGCKVEKWSLIHVGEEETKTETERERDR